MSTAISVLVVAVILFFAIRYIVRAKKRGVKCIGCSSACNCGCGGSTAKETECNK